MSLAAAAVVLMVGQAIPEVPAPEAAPAAVAAPTEVPAPAPSDNTVVILQPPVLNLPAMQPDGTTVTDPAAGSIDEPIGDEIVVTRRKGPPPGDPLEQINITSFKAVQAVDAALVEPVAKAYNKGLPRPVRQGLRNVFSNLREPVVFIAYMLELKPGKAAETAGRFLVNSTIGVAGLMDVAKRKPFNLPHHTNGLANVLGYYGVGPGPYFYLPIIGPTTLRDLVGDTVDNLATPLILGSPFNKPKVAIPMTVLYQLGERAAFDDEIGRIREDDNPYATYRDLYLRQREAEIEALHGRILPNVVPVYGHDMVTPGGKKDKAEGGEDTPEPQP